LGLRDFCKSDILPKSEREILKTLQNGLKI